MNKSESIGELAKSLCLSQREMKSAAKSSDNPFFRSKYADLATVWETAQEIITRNGLSVCQGCEPEYRDGKLVVTMLLMHGESGQWIESYVPLSPVPAKVKDADGATYRITPQSEGSCVTYGRRYLLQSMLGIVSDDDDGNAASGNAEPKGKATHPILTSKLQLSKIIQEWAGVTESKDVLNALDHIKRMVGIMKPNEKLTEDDFTVMVGWCQMNAKTDFAEAIAVNIDDEKE